jgi:hypothetical protein
MPRKKAARLTETETERVQRPSLPRTEPIRAWSTLFGAQAAATDGARSPAAGARNGAGDAVQRGVEFGYRVIDEYVKQGTAVASAFTSPNRPAMPMGEDLPRMTERMMQYASDFSAVWFDAMGVLMNGASGQASGPGSGFPQPPSAPRAAPSNGATAAEAAADPSRYVLDVRSDRPAEIILTLDEAIGGKLRVEPLRARAKKTTINDVALELPDGGGPMKLRVRVPRGLTAGRYTGQVLDASTKAPRGRLTVVLGGD